MKKAEAEKLLVACESSNIKAIGFDQAKSTIVVAFKNDAIYYGAATLEEVKALLGAPSIGAHYNKHFRSRPMTKIEDE